MTKREFDEFKESECPCGNGRIARHVESTVYRFTSVHISYSIDCSDCRRTWKLDHGTLVLRESEIAYLSAKTKSDIARHKLHDLAQNLVRAYCETQAFNSKKAELEHLQEIGVCEVTYAYYTKGRREGKQMFEMAYGLKNKKWLRSVAVRLQQEDFLSTLIFTDQEASKKTEAASRKIVRRAFK